MKNYQSFLSENFQFLELNFSIYLNRRVFVMPKVGMDVSDKKQKVKLNLNRDRDVSGQTN